MQAQDNRRDSLGRKQGHWVAYKQGHKSYEGKFVDDRPQGEMLRYYPDGRLMAQLQFDTHSDRVYATLYHQGRHRRVQAKGMYRGVYKDSLWQYFLPQGDMVSEGSYRNNAKEGLWRYYDQGVLMQESIYAQDSMHGAQKYYFKNGQLQDLMHYHNGQLHGVVEVYYADGQLRCQGAYVHGEPQGQWYYYEPDGQLRYEETYEQGRRIRRADAQGQPYIAPPSWDTTNLHIDPYNIKY